MSDDESNDSMDELQELIAEYDAKAEAAAAEEKELKSKPTNSKKMQYRKKNIHSEVPMDKVLFGDKKGLIRNLAKAVSQPDPGSQDATSSKLNTETDTDDGVVAKKRKPAWVDPDDEEITVGDMRHETKYSGPLQKDKKYKEYLQARFLRNKPTPKWAQLDRKKEKKDIDSDDEDLLKTVGFVAGSKSLDSLRPTVLSTKRLKDLNRASYTEGSVNAVQFHPTSTAALVAGSTGIATIYAVDGYKNEKLHSIFFQDFPITCARITPCGTKAIFGSLRRVYYSYDLLSAQEQRHYLPRDITNLRKFEISPCGRYLASAGRFGSLHLYDVRAHELLRNLKQEGDITDICFTGDSQRILCSSESGSVNIFSLRQQRLEHTFVDEGCIHGNVLDLASNQRLLATGSREGVVNVYDFEQVLQTKIPVPEKRILNLTTAITDLKFNHSSELLAFSSYDVMDSVKLAHFPSGTVYNNFPGLNPEVGKVRTVNFSPASGYLALGTHNKKVALFRIKYFKNY